MNELTNVGLSAIAKTHEDVMRGLFNLTIHPPKKIEVEYQKGDGCEELAVIKWSDHIQIMWCPF